MGAATVATVEELPGLEGAELGAAAWQPIEQERIDAFADTTLDRQWIHVDPERAATGPFGAPIAHGFLTLALCSHFLEQILAVSDAAVTINYGLQKVRFPAPVPVGSEVRGVGRVLAVEERPECVQLELEMTVERRGGQDDKPACVAVMVLRFYR